MARYKLTFVFIPAIISFCLCELDLQQKGKLVNGFVEFYNSLPNEIYACDEGFLQSAQQTDISNAYDINVSLKVSDRHNLDSTKYLKCTATVADLAVGVAVMKHQCLDDPNPGANPTNLEEKGDAEPDVVTETTLVRRPIQLDNEVQTDTAVTSGEQFIAIPREEPKVNCVSCASHVNPQAQGVSELAALGVRQLNSLEPNIQHTLTSVVDVERQVQVVNGVRYILTLIIDYNSCSTQEVDPCFTSKACKITILEKPWMQLPDGSKYRAILSNNCTEEWRFGDDGMVVPPSDNQENNNINPTNPDSGSDIIKAIHNDDVQSQQQTEKTLTDQDIKNLEEQIIPLNQVVGPLLTKSTSTTLGPPLESKEHVVKEESANQYNPNSIQTNKPQKVENLDDDKKKAIDDLLNFFNFAGFDSNSNQNQEPTRMKRSFASDLSVMNIAEKFKKVKKNMENAKLIYTLAQTVVDYLNEMDLEVKDRVLKDVTSAEEESENSNSFFYIQFRTTVPCKSNVCKDKDSEIKICNAVVDSSEKNPQILNVFCHVEEKIKNPGKMDTVPLNDPVLHKLIQKSLKKIESESQSNKALKLNKIIDARTQRVSGTLTKFSIVLDQTDCDKSVPFKLRINCPIVEKYGSLICDVTIHERHWLKESAITHSCTERPIDIRFSAIRRDAVVKNPNDPVVLDIVQEALQKLEDQSNRNNKQIAIRVNSVTTKLVAGFLTKIEFIVGYTNCPSSVNAEESQKCRLLENEPLKTCTAKVWDRTWMADGRQVEVSCMETNTETIEKSKRLKRSVIKEQDVNDSQMKILANESLQNFLQNSKCQTHYSIIQLERASVQVEDGLKYILEFKISPTDCQVDDEGKPTSSDCIILNPADISSCSSEIWARPWLNDKKVIDVSCHIREHGIKVKRSLSVGGVTEQNANDPTYKQLAEESLQKYLQTTDNSQTYTLIINKVTTQVVAGSVTLIDFKASPKIENSSEVISCHSKIWEQSWLNKKEIDVSCTIDAENKRTKRETLGGHNDVTDLNDPKFKHGIKVKRSLSVGGVTEQNANDPTYKQLAEESLQKYLQTTDNSQTYTLIINKVTTQVVAGSLTLIDFKASPKIENSSEVISCHSKIWEQTWLNKKEIDVSCTIDAENKRTKRETLGGHIDVTDLNDPKFKHGIKVKRSLSAGGVTEQNANDPTYKQLAEESLQKYLQTTDNSQTYTLIINKVTTQVVAGSMTRIDFKASPKIENSSDVISCHSEIWEQTWLNKKEINVSCTIDAVNKRTKRQTLGGHNEVTDLNDPKYKQLAEESLQYLYDTDNLQPHAVLEVHNVSVQVVSGTITKISFKIIPTAQTSDLMVYDVKSCISEIWERKWINKKDFQVKCESDSTADRMKRNIITGGFTDQDPNNPKYRELAQKSLQKYLHDAGISQPQEVITIEKVFTQVVSGIRTIINFNIAPKPPISGDVTSCKSDIWQQHWQDKMEITVNCELNNQITEDKSETASENRVKRYIKDKNMAGGVIEEDPTKEEFKNLARDSLKKYQKKKKGAKGHVFVEVKKVSSQVVSGVKYKIDFIAAPKSCARDVTTCDNENPLLNCHSDMVVRPWLLEKDIHVSCNTNRKRNKRNANLNEKDELELNELEITYLNERGKRQAGVDDDYVDDETRFYYADRAIQHLNEQSKSSNLFKLITIHAVQNSMHMDNTPMVRMYIEVAETFCLRHLDDQKVAECEEMDGNNNMLCLARIWPSPDDDRVIQQVSVVCDDDEKFESITGLSLPMLLKLSIKHIEQSPQLKYKLVHQGEPHLIPSLDSTVPMKLNFIVRTTNCSKNLVIERGNKYNCFVDVTKPAKACTSFISLVPNSRAISKLTASCAKTEFRQKRSISLSKENATADDLEIQKMVEESLEKLEMTTPQRYKQKVLAINGYSTKVTSGKITTIDFDIGFTSCLKYEWVDDIKSCEIMEHLPRRHCISEVWERLWLNNGRNIEVRCEDEIVPLEAHVEFENADTALALANRALRHIEAKYPHPRKQKVVRIYSLDKQVVAGVHYRMKMEIGVTNCSALSADDYCVIDEHGGAVNKFCRVNVWLRPWTDHPPNFRVTCDYQDGAAADLYYQIQAEHLFRDFLSTYGPGYINDHDELLKRFEVFKANIIRIHELNTHERGTAIYGLTRFADMTYEEFTKKHMGLKPSLLDNNQVPMRKAMIPTVDIPTTFDWREHGAVTEVKDQGSCGSCWAFSVTGNIEGQWQLKSGKLVSLSEQELVDCDKMDDGCNGGLPDNAYRAIEQLGGLETETDYPYEGEDDKCAFNKSMSSVQITGAVNITTNETDMAKWLVKNGPISIGINANAMQFYMGGVSHPWKMLCSPSNLDHGVLIVGYGVKNYPLFHKRLPYWIVKNSWGPSWGEKGYYRVFRGDGTCGVNQMASSAVI